MNSQQQPALALVYGESGTGKTADTIYAFPNAMFIAAPGALNCAKGLVGVDIPASHRKDCTTIEDAIAVCRAQASAKDAPVAVVIDDLSLLVQRTVMHYEKRGAKGFDLWRHILNLVLELADVCRYSLRSHFVMSAHIQPPHDVRGEYIKGGPMLPGKGAAVLPKHCDIALRAVAQDARLLWKFAYQCRNSDEAYTTKDRNNVCADAAPMNLAEIMRLSGYEVPRVLQWQESVVAKLSEKLLGKSADEIREVLRAARPTIEKKYTTNRLHIAWTFRDAIDRATLMQTRPDPLTDLGI